VQTCREDGTLLKPHCPAANLDSTFAAALADKKAPGGSSYIGIPSVWGTTMSAGPNATSTRGAGSSSGSSVSSSVSSSSAALAAMPPIYHLLLFANVSAGGYSVQASELQQIEAEARRAPDFAAQFGTSGSPSPSSSSSSATATFVGREFYSQALRVVGAAAALHVAHAPRPAACANLGLDKPLGMYCVPFELWAVAPLPAAGGWVLLGEVDKYVSVSGQRFRGLAGGAGGLLSSTVVGTPKEAVTVAVLDCRVAGSCVTTAELPEPVVVRCVLGVGGTAKLECGAECTCG
jgi:hypothetical protein